MSFAEKILLATEKILALSLLIQSIEFLFLYKAFTDKGVWRWHQLKKELPQWLAIFLGQRSFLLTLIVRLLAAVALFSFTHPGLLFILLVSTVLVLVRFRGTFNGGSDYMTLIILMGLFVARSFPESPKIIAGALWYIAIQVCISFFIAGLIKLKRENWRQGRALPSFMKTSIYQKSWLVLGAAQNPRLMKFTSWMVIMFEVSFPLALAHPLIALAFFPAAYMFQLGNIYLFGLNRFLYAWLAGFPSIYFCTGFLQRGWV